MIEICSGAASEWLCQYRGKKPAFACVLSFTETGLIEHISAAGQTADDRRYTAVMDGEFLLAEDATLQAASHSPLPKLAAGVSPAVITRAVVRSLSIPHYILSTGLSTPLQFPHIALPSVRARAVHTGCAMSLSQAKGLFQAGLHWGKRLAPAGSYLVIGECVVGGTTTAQAVLSGLGYAVAGRMSSSHPGGNHAQKQTLVQQGLSSVRSQRTSTPFSLAAAVGDPMQLVVAGMALSASQRGGVLLAGGAQMLAVYGLAWAIARHAHVTWQPEQVVIGTTRWVIEDESADTVAIAGQLKAPYLASQISFGQSPYVQLRAYEQGFVKEGVGAGGCAIAAHLYKGWGQSQLRHAVEAQLRYV
ncbi:MAG: nicotinate mononucleotide-dependent phosphoribosyltransferase CobT [Cyanobacteria bacterium J06555_13]